MTIEGEDGGPDATPLKSDADYLRANEDAGTGLKRYSAEGIKMAMA